MLVEQKAGCVCLPEPIADQVLFLENSGSQRFPRTLRITQSSGFARVLSNPDIKKGSPELLVLAKKNNLGVPRLGMAVSKKHLPASVARNRIKRLIRESFRKAQGRLNGWDIVVLTRAKICLLSARDLDDLLEKHWQRLTPCDT